MCDLIFNKIKEKTMFVSEYSGKNEKILLVGHVQSGKTMEILGYCWWSIFILKTPVIIFVRNFKIDIIQFIDRVSFFNENIVVDKNYYIEINTDNSSVSNCIYIQLANHIQAQKILRLVLSTRMKYNLCLDEADYAIKSNNNRSKLECSLKYIEKYSCNTLLATATPFAILIIKRDITKILKMKMPLNYYSLDHIQVKKVIVNSDLRLCPQDDTNLKTIYTMFLKKEHGIMFHFVTRLKEAQFMLMCKLAKMFEQLTIVVFNGDGAFIRTNMPSNAKKTLTATELISDDIDNVIHIRKIQLNKVLQLLKDDISTHTHVVIIGGNMISRGVSVVSEDYEWHLTDQYFHPPVSSHGESLIQSLRILGKYTDNPVLTLWCTEKTWNDICEQTLLIHKCVEKCQTDFNLKKINIIKPTRNPTRPKIMGHVKFSTKDKHIMEVGNLGVVEYSEDENES